MLFFPESGVQWLVHLLSGRARIKDRPELPMLDPGDSLWLDAVPGDTERLILDGGGELLLSRIASVGG
jgi:hypothetical protein